MSNQTAITPATARQEFGSQELTPVTETATSAAAAQAQAAVQARYIVAMKRPRDWLQVRASLLAECKRKGFAKSALYSKPVGKSSIVGFSIRFAEAALRCMTNMMPETITLYDDPRKRIIRVQVTDLEANLTYAADLTIEKTVERRQLGKGQQAISTRMNSFGSVVYLVEATEGDFMNKEGANISKSLRNLALRMLPGDIQDDCREELDRTMLSHANADPQAEKKGLADAFGVLGISPQELGKYLGHSLDTITGAEIVNLRQVYSAVKSREASWHEVMASRVEAEDEQGAKPEGSKKAQNVKDRIKAAAAKGKGVDEVTTAEARKGPEIVSQTDVEAEESELTERPDRAPIEGGDDMGYDLGTGEVTDE